MHVDQMLAEWLAPVWEKMGAECVVAVLVLAALYWVIKGAIKNGFKEALDAERERRG